MGRLYCPFLSGCAYYGRFVGLAVGIAVGLALPISLAVAVVVAVAIAVAVAMSVSVTVGEELPVSVARLGRCGLFGLGVGDDGTLAETVGLIVGVKVAEPVGDGLGVATASGVSITTVAGTVIVGVGIVGIVGIVEIVTLTTPVGNGVA